MTEFAARVLAAARRIPAGQVATYGDLAELAGRPGASRAVGTIMRRCSTLGVPCHRVVAAGGALGGYGGNLELKRALLRAEGVMVLGRRIRHFARVRWKANARARARGKENKLVARAGSTQRPTVRGDETDG